VLRGRYSLLNFIGYALLRDDRLAGEDVTRDEAAHRCVAADRHDLDFPTVSLRSAYARCRVFDLLDLDDVEERADGDALGRADVDDDVGAVDVDHAPGEARRRRSADELAGIECCASGSPRR